MNMKKDGYLVIPNYSYLSPLFLFWSPLFCLNSVEFAKLRSN